LGNFGIKLRRENPQRALSTLVVFLLVCLEFTTNYFETKKGENE